MTAPPCTRCGKPRKRRADNRGWTGARGLCAVCYERSRAAGTPGTVPSLLGSRERSARISAGMSAWHAPRLAANLQDYAWLTSFGESREHAALRVGISVFTARNYERRLAWMAARGTAA